MTSSTVKKGIMPSEELELTDVNSPIFSEMIQVSFSHFGKKLFRFLHSQHNFLTEIKKGKAIFIFTFDFFALYTKIPHDKLLFDVVQECF